MLIDNMQPEAIIKVMVVGKVVPKEEDVKVCGQSTWQSGMAS
jgi:hypothetical protein